MTVSKKMGLLILSAVLGILLLVGVAVVQMNRVFTSANYANDNVVPSVMVLDRGFSAMAALRTQVWQHIIAPDASHKQELEQQISAKRAKVDEALKDYESLISDDKDKAMLEAERKVMGEYDAIREKVLVMSRENRIDDARSLMMANQQLMARMWDAFEDHRQ